MNSTARWTTIGIAAVIVAVPQTPQAGPPAPVPPDSARANALHLLNRITFGPRPGDVDRVVAMGIGTFLEEQLQPSRIDDSDLDRRLEHFEILRRTPDQLEDDFRQVQRARIAAQARAGDTIQPGRRASAGMMAVSGLRRLLGEFQQLAVVRATESNRQLYEVMADFWTNHFNVFIGKNAVRYLAPHYIEHTIRPHALGRFEDLLIATARDPAMLVYLDNVQSIAPGAQPPQLANAERRLRAQRRRIARLGTRRSGDDETRRSVEQRMRMAEEGMNRLRERLPSGLNENYARELLELHTLGVDGGYTQDDVVNVARIFTGWGVGGPTRRQTTFAFSAWAHDVEPKTVLGREFVGGGMDEGIELLRMLARHPSTMRHVSGKLCQRLVSDDPAPGCVDAAVEAWQESDGDISRIVNAVIQSEEFWAARTAGSKTKTPFEFVVSAVRALDGTPDTTLGLAQVVRRLGQPLYSYEAPTGYPETQQEWVSAGALLDRLNVAMGFAANRIPGAHIDLDRIVPATSGLDAMIQSANDAILNGTATANTLRVLRGRTESIPRARDRRIMIVALCLGSPEFQRQ